MAMIPDVVTPATLPERWRAVAEQRSLASVPRGQRAEADLGHAARQLLRGAAIVAMAQWPLDAAGLLPVSSRTLLFVTAALTGAMLSAVAAAAGLRASVGRRRPPRRTLLVGAPDHVVTAWATLADATGNRLAPVASCEPAELGSVLPLVQPELVLALPNAGLDGRVLQRMGWQLEAAGIPLAVSAGLADVHPWRLAPQRVGRLGMVAVRASRRRGLRALVKSAWERSAAFFGLLVLSPLLLTLAAIVKLDSPGPALFRQVRVGRDGRQFTMLKFRTMYTDAEQRRTELTSECDGPLFKVRADPRITGVGRILRKFSLDELPQLINVVTGTMALVGPRPALPTEVMAYDQDPKRRLAVRPGLTGLWQVSGRSDLSWAESVRLDLDYVDNWTLRRDLLIVARTLRAVIAHKGAY